MQNLVHLNDNVMCAITIKTSGIRPMYHDLYEICIYPLDAGLKIVRGLLPFHFMMQLKREENLTQKEIDRIDLTKIKMSIDPWRVADFFETWVEKLNLPNGKKIVPLSSNWAVHRGFILDWLNDGSFEKFISDDLARDVRSAAHYLNDRYDFLNEPVPFSKTNFRYICSTLKIDNPSDHNDLIWEAVNLAEAYRKTILYS